MRFRTKPFEIEAVLFDGNNEQELYGFCGWKFRKFEDARPHNDIVAQVYDELHDTWVGVKAGQWIILGQKGEFYPCDPDIFGAKYEPVDVVSFEVHGDDGQIVAVHEEAPADTHDKHIHVNLSGAITTDAIADGIRNSEQGRNFR